MAVTLLVTPGASNANSYCSKAESDAYHANHPYGSVWTAADGQDIQPQTLILATQILDEQYEWDGNVSSSTQSLLWPRFGVYGKNGYRLASDAIPNELRNATAELARLLMTSDRTVDNDAAAFGVTYLAVGSIQMKLNAASTKMLTDRIEFMVGHLGRQSSILSYTFRT